MGVDDELQQYEDIDLLKSFTWNTWYAREQKQCVDKMFSTWIKNMRELLDVVSIP